MELTLDFECGGGKSLTRLGDDHWRLETKCDSFGYERYFCVRAIRQKEDRPAVLHLEIHPDAKGMGKSIFATHFPCDIWYDTRKWTRWVPLRHTWEDAVVFRDGWIDLRVPIAPGTEMHIASNVPLRYSDMLGWIGEMVRRHPDRLEFSSIGRSFEGRDIPLLRIRSHRKGAPKVFFMAGQHSGEHSGCWACQGVVEYLLSNISEAREMVERFDWAVVPMFNPDGNVHGWSGATAEDAIRLAAGKTPLNPSLDFADAAQNKQPELHESRLLWNWLCAEFAPDAMVHFHGYMGWRQNGARPGDGIYEIVDWETVFQSKERRDAYSAIKNRLLFETPGHSAHFRITGRTSERMIEHQLATRFGTVGVLYEINVSCGVLEQFQRGPQVLKAMIHALVKDAGWA